MSNKEPQNVEGLAREHFVMGHSLFGVLRFMAIRERQADVVRFGHTLRQATLASTYLAEGLPSP